MGQKEKSSSEVKFSKLQKTESGASARSAHKLNSKGTKVPTASATGRTAELRALLLSLNNPPDEWPGEALRAIIRRFKRMPRGGWHVLCELAQSKLGKELSIGKLKKLAEPAISQRNGKKCSRANYLIEVSKKLKPVEQILEEKTLRETRLKSKAKCMLRQ